MPILSDVAGTLFLPVSYERERDFEQAVIGLTDAIFGRTSIYVDVKKQIRGDDFVTIPDGYVVDMTEADSPSLFIVENEIVRHDPFRHVGIQLLKFVTSFEDARPQVRNFLMHEIAARPEHLKRLQTACDASGTRNIDAYLDMAVYREFRGLVVIDEARPELHRVIEKINADISVLELRSFEGDDGRVFHVFDTLYDDDEQGEIPPINGAVDADDRRAARQARRAASDTIVVPAREEGFRSVFLGQDSWHSIRIGAAMKGRLTHIAAYQVAPHSAVTHVAEIDEIKPYQDTGKYLVIFKGPARKIRSVPVADTRNAPQGPVYVKLEDLERAETLEEAMLVDGDSS